MQVIQSYIDWKVQVSLNSFDVFISLYPGICAAQGPKSLPLEGQKFIFFIFVTHSWTLEVKIITLKDDTYPYAFLPKPFQQH